MKEPIKANQGNIKKGRKVSNMRYESYDPTISLKKLVTLKEFKELVNECGYKLPLAYGAFNENIIGIIEGNSFTPCILSERSEKEGVLITRFCESIPAKGKEY